MLLSYRDPHFWKKFDARHWRPRVPTVIRQPFKVFPFSEETLLRALISFEEGLRGGDQRIHCLVSIGDSEKAPRRPLRKLFRQESESMEQLEKNCARVFAKQSFGLMVTSLQAVDPGIWSGMTEFLQDARGCIDYPVPRAFLDLFYGNYSSSFTGLHKDTQEIFAFVVRGEKRILAWPFDYFLSRVEGLTPADRYFHMRLPVDYRKYRKDALVLDARAGDVFYWPSDRWHIAEARPGCFSAMLSLGLFRPDFVTPKSARAGAASARQLRWATSFGFELGGPVADPPPGRRDEAVTVVKKKSSILLWQVNPSHRRILVASNGHSVTLPHASRLVTLLERISRGESVTVTDIPRRAGGDARLVRWLLRVYAVEREN